MSVRPPESPPGQGEAQGDGMMGPPDAPPVGGITGAGLSPPGFQSSGSGPVPQNGDAGAAGWVGVISGVADTGYGERLCPLFHPLTPRPPSRGRR